MKKKKSMFDGKTSSHRSICCLAPVTTNMSPDFIGDDPKTMIVGTCYFLCSTCGQPCDILVRKNKKKKAHLLYCNKNILQDEIDKRYTEKNMWAIITACDIILRLRLGQFHIIFEQLIRYMKPNLKELKNAREDLHKLVDVICDNEWQDKKYGGLSKKLHDLTWEMQGKYYTIGQPVDIQEPTYKAMELAELILCKIKHGECEFAKECDPMRKGFCERKKK